MHVSRMLIVILYISVQVRSGSSFWAEMKVNEATGCKEPAGGAISGAGDVKSVEKGGGDSGVVVGGSTSHAAAVTQPATRSPSQTR